MPPSKVSSVVAAMMTVIITITTITTISVLTPTAATAAATAATATSTARRRELLHDLVLNSLAVRSVAQLREMGTDGVHQATMLRRRRDVQRGLHHVVAVGVLQQHRESVLTHHLVDHPLACLVVAHLEAFLDHVRAELLGGEVAQVAAEARAHLVGSVLVGEVEHVLHHVVAVRVAHQSQGETLNGVHQLLLLRLVGVVDAALQHTAAVAVRGHRNTVLGHRVVDELVVAVCEAVQTALHDVVAVQVLDQRHHVVLQRQLHQLHLFGRAHELDHLLHGAGAVHVGADAHQLRGDVADQHQTLLGVAVLEQLLTEVVAERIGHQLGKAFVRLLEDDVERLGVVLVQLLLQEAAAVLVAAERKHRAHHLLDGLVGEA
mmetsp:Transcript_1697/g.5250  ORF Transcript_1697/g.5250 Transcript_1697/m.5250 type:complete len:376 (+) Transcript_1697:220-1347(+)